MTSDFRQCAAAKSNGERCQRVAKKGAYCYSHRNNRPKADYSHLDPYKDLHLHVEGHHTFICRDCGEAVQEVVLLEGFGNNPAYYLCLDCYGFQHRIERRIAEICSVPGGLHVKKILEDLEQFGVDPATTEEVRQRMLREKKLVETTPSSPPTSDSDKRKSLFDF